MKYLASVSYDGSNFVGWQIQPNGRSVEEEIERVLSLIFDTKIKIYGSGRTDAGVHALNQYFDFKIDKEFDKDKLRYSLNKLLPKDIHINSIILVEDGFSARFSSISKSYRYIINMGELDVFKRNYECQFHQKLDVDLIIDAADLFIGKHCFQNFTSKEEDEGNFIRTINFLNIKLIDNRLIIDINGDGFMRYMVRMIVATLIEIGLKKINKDYISETLDSNIRKPVPYKAKANGLYLVDVFY